MLNTFKNNNYNYLFCLQGCVYTMVIERDAHPTHNIHNSNQYRNIFGVNAAIQLTTVLDQKTRVDIEHGLNYTYSI